MRKEILDALRAKFVGVSDAILGRIADKLSKTVTTAEQVATAVEGVTIQQVIDSYGDSRATEATQTAVSNYEKKHGLKEGQKVQGGAPASENEPKDEENKDTPEWAKSIIASNKTLTEKLALLEGEKVTSARKGQLSKLIEKLPEELQKPYARMAIDTLTDEEFSTLTTDITTEVESISSTLAAKGAVFSRPTGGGVTTETKPADKEVEAVAKAMGL